jgi:hypothetical protein
MASNNRDSSDRIGLPDPVNEPEPPKLGSAGALGPVGERKQEEACLADKDAIWRDPAQPPHVNQERE